MVKKVKFKVGDKLVITRKGKHGFPIGTEVSVIRVMSIKGIDNIYDVCQYPTGDCALVEESQIDFKQEKTEQMTNSTMKKQIEDLVFQAANDLAKANNTVSTLEIKTKLVKEHPYLYWTQKIVSDAMIQHQNNGSFTFVNNTLADGTTYRIYSSTSKKVYKAPKTANKVSKSKVTTGALAKTGIRKTATAVPKATSISRSKALELIQGNKGRFFTATFVKKDLTERTINCQYLKDQDEIKLGYVKVRESNKLKSSPSDSTRQINLQTLISLKIGGVFYKIRK